MAGVRGSCRREGGGQAGPLAHSLGSGWMAGERRLDPWLGGGLARGTTDTGAGAFPTGWLRREQARSPSLGGKGGQARALVQDPAPDTPRRPGPPHPHKRSRQFRSRGGFWSPGLRGSLGFRCVARLWAPGRASARSRGESGLRARRLISATGPGAQLQCKVSPPPSALVCPEIRKHSGASPAPALRLPAPPTAAGSKGPQSGQTNASLAQA